MSVSRRFVLVPSAVRRFIGAASSLAFLSLAPPVRGEERAPSVWVERPNAVRSAGMVYVSLPAALGDLPAIRGDGPIDGFGGVTYSRQLLERFALEGAVGGGGQGRHAGVHLGLGARVLVTKWETMGLTLALGTHAAFLHDYGPVAFLHAEAAWEMRLRWGLNVIAGGGLAAPLNDSRRGRACSQESTSGASDLCERFNVLSPGPWAHVEAGWSF